LIPLALIRADAGLDVDVDDPDPLHVRTTTRQLLAYDVGEGFGVRGLK
jgi:hypothetical protein